MYFAKDLYCECENKNFIYTCDENMHGTLWF